MSLQHWKRLAVGLLAHIAYSCAAPAPAPAPATVPAVRPQPQLTSKCRGGTLVQRKQVGVAVGATTSAHTSSATLVVWQRHNFCAAASERGSPMWQSLLVTAGPVCACVCMLLCIRLCAMAASVLHRTLVLTV
jgi:hypothetical protein